LLSECWCESPRSSQYRVRDFWNWHRNFEAFRARFPADCEPFEEWLCSEKLLEKEQFLGAYYEKFGDGRKEDFGVS